MPRRALRCVVDLTLQRVSAPGVWLPSREDIYVSISMFGQYRNTRNVTSVFPLLYHEPFRFEKTYYTALDPSDVADFLDDELVVMELLQYSDYSAGAVRLASFSCSAREFLFPYPSLCPSYTSTSREILFSRTIAFPGISPKLEFTTKTVIKESRSVELDALEDALEEEKIARRSRSRSRSRSRARSRSVSRTRSLSRTRTCRSSSSDSEAGFDSDPSYMRPTLSSIFRSRSKSALEKSLIGRMPGSPPLKPQKLRRSRSLTRSGSGYSGRLCSARCPVCSTLRQVFVSSRDCLVCQAYKRHMGKTYWGHGPRFHPTGIPCCNVRKHKVLRDSLGSTPVYSTRYVSDKYLSDDDDDEVAALTSSRSYALSPRPRSVSPYLYKPTYSSRFTRPYSPILTASERVDLEIARARSRARARALALSPLPLRYTPILSRSLEDLAIDTCIARRSDIHLAAGQYWTQRATELTGTSHRDVFNNSMDTIYNGLLARAVSKYPKKK